MLQGMKYLRFLVPLHTTWIQQMVGELLVWICQAESVRSDLTIAMGILGARLPACSTWIRGFDGVVPHPADTVAVVRRPASIRFDPRNRERR
ncbi:hypothetical protein X734_32850 [Mesorhizobium sp. L2C084A000]|nr:hypothetical protein X734_32850 [Mesorhizobium sp. L2C084A000]